jgi:hypothetical protein
MVLAKGVDEAEIEAGAGGGGSVVEDVVVAGVVSAVAAAALSVTVSPRTVRLAQERHRVVKPM